MTMNISKFAASVVSLAAVLVLVNSGCDGGREGERCNPALSHNDCDNGLTCQQPSTCAENYCCPADPTKSTSPYCNGAACPAADAGAVDAADAATSG
jgi:hypothetical protein